MKNLVEIGQNWLKARKEASLKSLEKEWPLFSIKSEEDAFGGEFPRFIFDQSFHSYLMGK